MIRNFSFQIFFDPALWTAGLCVVITNFHPGACVTWQSHVRFILYLDQWIMCFFNRIQVLKGKQPSLPIEKDLVKRLDYSSLRYEVSASCRVFLKKEKGCSCNEEDIIPAHAFSPNLRLSTYRVFFSSLDWKGWNIWPTSPDVICERIWSRLFPGPLFQYWPMTLWGSRAFLLSTSFTRTTPLVPLQR